MELADGGGRSREITYLLKGWQKGDEEARELLIRVVYDELRRIARAYLSRERDGATLQPTELVNEAFIRLVEQKSQITWEDRVHFFGITARLMRQILIEHQRRRSAAKRGGPDRDLLLDEIREIPESKPLDLLKLDEALDQLEQIDAEKCRLVELRFFTGLTLEETARVLSTSVASVKREWTLAKAWLYRYIHGGTPTS